MNFLEEIEDLALETAARSFRDQIDRNLDIIKKRFALTGEEYYTLEEIGRYYDITRERVRQIEEKTINNLRVILSGGMLKNGFSSPNQLNIKFESLKKDIYSQGNIALEADVINCLSNRFSIQKDAKCLNVTALILELLGYFKLPKNINGYSGQILDCWCLTDSFDPNSIVSIFKVLNKYRSKAEKIKIFDLIVSAKREYRENINKELLCLILKACPDYYQADEESIEVKIESLPNLSEKAYRVLTLFNEPKHCNDILREINFRLSSNGRNDIATYENLKNQMASDVRFVSIGKSGYWALKKWNGISTESITELMELNFHKENCSQSVDQIFNFVSSKRPGVSRKSIVTYLHDKPQFIRTGDDQYSLAAWGDTSVSKEKLSSDIVTNKIKEAMEEIFSARDVIPNAELVGLIRKKSGVSDATIRKAIRSCKEIEVLPGSGRSNSLKCNDLRLPSLSTKLSKTLLRNKVQEAVVKVMSARSGVKIQKIDLYAEVSKLVDCVKPTFYRYLSEMNCIKQYDSDNKYYCEMDAEKPAISTISYLDLSPIYLCQENDVIENVIKATDKLNEMDVDIGLFELGRIFENLLRKYLEKSRENKIFDVFKKDTEKLVCMIECIERNKEKIPVKFKQHHLTILREDRNLRAHGEMPSKLEKQAILAKAPFIVEMYIDYIVKLSGLISDPNPGKV